MGCAGFWVDLLLCGVVLLGQYWWRKTEEANKDDLVEKLPGPEVQPFIGNAWTIWGQHGDFFENLVRCIGSFSSPMRLVAAWKPYVIFRDPHQIEKIFTSASMSTKDDTYDFLKDFTGESLVSSSGPKWKKDRRLFSPVCLKRNVTQYFEVISRHCLVLGNVLEKNVDGGTFNVGLVIERAVADFINETIIGSKTDAQGGHLEDFLEEIRRLRGVIHDKLSKPWLQLPLVYILSPTYRRQLVCKELLQRFFWKALRDAEQIHSHLGHKDATRSMLEQMLDFRDEVPDFASDQELVHHLTAFFLASQDTISLAASFALLMLGMHQEHQEKVVAEIRQVVGSGGVKEEHLAKLEYLEMVIKECLRLFPAAPVILRQTSQDIELGGCRIPKGISVAVAVHNIHRDPKYWEKPNEFYPGHFTTNAIENRHAYAYLPFSAGVRSCLGKPYAYMALKILLVTVLQRYVVEAEGLPQELLLSMDVSVRLRDGNYAVKIRRRV